MSLVIFAVITSGLSGAYMQERDRKRMSARASDVPTGSSNGGGAIPFDTALPSPSMSDWVSGKVKRDIYADGPMGRLRESTKGCTDL